MKKINSSFKIQLLIVLFTGLLLANSCIRDNFEFDKFVYPDEWSPDGAVALINASMTVGDLFSDLGDNQFREGDGDLMYMVFEDTVYTPFAADLIRIPNQSISSQITFTPSGFNNTGDVFSYSYNNNYEFTYPYGEEIDKILVKSGTLEFSVNLDAATASHDVRINVTVPTAIKAGSTLVKSIVIPANSSLPFAYSIDISNYELTFGATNTNEIAFNYEVVLTHTGANAPSTSSVSLNERMYSIEFKELYGYFGQRTFDLGNAKSFIDLFKDDINGNLHFDDPKVRFTCLNSYGAPFNASVSDFYSNNSFVINQIISSALANPFTLNYPSISDIGQTETTFFVVDKNNSNLSSIIDGEPDTISARINVEINPNGSAANFATDISQLTMVMGAELPFNGYADDMLLDDTVKLEWENIEELEYVQFNIDINNGFPIDILCQLYFTDSNGVVLDSLLAPLEQMVLSADIGAGPEFRVTNSKRKITTIIWEQDRLQGLEGMSQIIISGFYESINSGQTTVKIYSDYRLDIKLSVRAKAELGSLINVQ